MSRESRRAACVSSLEAVVMGAMVEDWYVDVLVDVWFNPSCQLDLVIDSRALSHAIGALIARCAVCRYRSAP
jgi:hypothetical protein